MRTDPPHSERVYVRRVAREGAAHCARGRRAPQRNCIVPAKPGCTEKMKDNDPNATRRMELIRRSYRKGRWVNLADKREYERLADESAVLQAQGLIGLRMRSEERRVGKECRAWVSP